MSTKIPQYASFDDDPRAPMYPPPTSPAPPDQPARLWIWILGVVFVGIAIALFVPLLTEE